MPKPIELEVETEPIEQSINEQGEYVIGIFMSNYSLDDELEESIRTVATLWQTEEIRQEVTLTINVRLRSVYEAAQKWYAEDNECLSGDMHIFEAMKADCQWIIDQINNIKTSKV